MTSLVFLWSRRARGCAIAGLLVAAFVASPAIAAPKTVVRLPLGSHFSALAVTPSGQAWVSADSGRAGHWALVSSDDRPLWSTYPAAGGFVGALSPRSDGGAWMLADLQTVLRISPDGKTSVLGPLDLPASDGPDAGRSMRALAMSDDSLVVVGEQGGLLRVNAAGTSARQDVQVPSPRTDGDCIYVDAAAAGGGALVLSDYRCWRLVIVGPFGVVRTVDLRPTRGRRYPGAVLAAADGSLWFTAIRLRGARVSHVVGHVASSGRVMEIAAPNATLGPSGFSQSPDGSIWAAVPRVCGLYRVAAGRLHRVNAPFPVRDVQFAADGSAWLLGYTRLAHMSVAKLAAAGPPRHCDGTSPRMTFPRVTRQRVSLRMLRRFGFRIRSSEPATLSGDVTLADHRFYIHRVIRRAEATTRVRFPRAALLAAARRLRQGARVDLSIGAELRDESGNGVVSPQEFRVVAASSASK